MSKCRKVLRLPPELLIEQIPEAGNKKTPPKGVAIGYSATNYILRVNQ